MRSRTGSAARHTAGEARKPAENAWFAVYPYAGAGRGSYPRLLARLRSRGHCHVPVLAGRDSRRREPALESFAALADDLWRQLDSELAARRDPADLVLFGFSMGALLATEMAARFQQRGDTPRGLVVAGSPPPHLLPRGKPISGLPDPQFVSALARQGVLPPDLLDEPDFVAPLLPTWRADCRTVESHPRRPVRLDCPIAALSGSEDLLVAPADLAVWEQVGGPGSTSTALPGGHAAVLDREDLLLDAVWTLAAGGAGGLRMVTPRSRPPPRRGAPCPPTIPYPTGF